MIRAESDPPAVEPSSPRPRLIKRRSAGPTGTPSAQGAAPGTSGPINASASQRRMWMVHQGAPQAAVHNVFFAVRLTGPLNVFALSQALNAVIERHPTLRTTFAWTRGELRQVVAPPAAVPLPLSDLSQLPTSSREVSLQTLLRTKSNRPFALEVAPLLRARLVRLTAQEHVLALTIHHIAVDGESVRLLLVDLGTAYGAVRAGGSADLPLLPARYADVAVWEAERARSGGLADDVDHWRRRLDGIDPVSLPTDRPPPDRASYRGSVVERTLPAELIAALRELGNAHRSSAFIVVTAALTALLHRYTGRDDIVIGAAFGGRPNLELEQVVGPFMRLLPLRTTMPDDPTFADLLDRVREVVLDATEHPHLPYVEVVEAVSIRREPGRHPLARISLAVQPYAPPSVAFAGLETSTVDPPVDRVEFDVEFGLRQNDIGSSATLWAKYATDLFDGDRIERLLGHFETLMRAVAAQPGTPLSRLPLLDRAELDQVERWNATVPLPLTAATVPELILPAAERAADRLAVTDGTLAITYRQLLDRSQRLAQALLAHGVGPDRTVAVCLPRSVAAVVAQLAVMRAGAAYLPLDPRQPAVRLAGTIADAAPVAVIAGAEHDLRLPDSLPRLTIGADGASPGPGTPPALPATQPTNTLAYVMYTSGSTGRPKGVMIDHHAALVHLTDAIHRYDLRPGDRFLQVAANTFDASVTQIFAPLARGATVCVAPEDIVASPPRLARFLASERVTLAVLTPTVLSRLPVADLPDLRILGIAGDQLPGPLAQDWQRPGRTVMNQYGPTEAAVEALLHVCPPDAPGPPPIGRPLPDRRAYVVDRTGALAPIGVAGELWIGGAGLARGYLGGPGLTAERFVPDPFGPTGARAYRTGDLVRQRPDGIIDYLGRIDHQVKVNGIRVDPAEIEEALRRQPDVRDVVVVAAGAARSRRLAAYVTVEDGPGVTEVGLRATLAEELPHHLVPSRIVILPEMPTTSSGKIDRGALPALAGPARAAHPNDAATDPLVRRIAAWCARQLEVDWVDPSANLFAAGGNSLDVMDLMVWTRREFGVWIDPADAIAAPTIAALADGVREAIDMADAALLDEIEALSDEEAAAQLEMLSQAAAGSD